MTKNDVIIRKALLSEGNMIKKVIKKAFEKYKELPIDKEVNPYYLSLERIRFNLNYQDGEFLVALVNDTIIGGLFYYFIGEKTIHIDQIFVDPLYQSKGIGTLLLNYVKDNDNIDTIYLDCLMNDNDNYQFYLHNEFKIDEEIIENEIEKYYLLLYKK